VPTQLHTFHCEIKKSGEPSTGRVTKVFCHGSVVSQTANELKEIVKPLIVDGGRIILDFKDVSYVDSLGLGTLVGLKVSAINQGYCTLEFEHLSQRIQDLLRITNLVELFKT
jgi:anti-anti-sigma factor